MGQKRCCLLFLLSDVLSAGSKLPMEELYLVCAQSLLQNHPALLDPSWLYIYKNTAGAFFVPFLPFPLDQAVSPHTYSTPQNSFMRFLAQNPT